MMNNLITPDIVTPESLIPVLSTTEMPKASRKLQASGNGKSPHKRRTSRIKIKSMKPASFYSNSEDAPKRIKTNMRD